MPVAWSGAGSPNAAATVGEISVMRAWTCPIGRAARPRLRYVHSNVEASAGGILSSVGSERVGA